MRSEFIATRNFCPSNFSPISSSQFLPRITRRNLPRGTNRGALQSETTSEISLRIREQSFDSPPRGSSSPSRSTRPAHPPKCARKSVARLPRISGTSTPPEMASQARPPRFGEISSAAPAETRAQCKIGIRSSPTRILNSPPAQATNRSTSIFNRTRPLEHSKPAMQSELPTRRLARRKDTESSAPPGVTPNLRSPTRPQSCTVVWNPAKITDEIILVRHQSVGGFSVALNKRNGVQPITFQPPGDSNG